MTRSALAHIPTPGNHRLGAGRPSAVFDVLGHERVVPYDVYPVTGRVLYYNPRAMERLGFRVPPSAHITKELDADLCRAFALRPNGDKAQEAVTLFADRYTTLEGTKGAGRAAFTRNWGAYVKGSGPTPLVGNGNQDHSSGATTVRQSMIEVLVSEIVTNLMEDSVPAGVLIIGLDEAVSVAGGYPPEPASILVRAALDVPAGLVRPAHMIEPWVYKEQFAGLVQIIKDTRGEVAERCVTGLDPRLVTQEVVEHTKTIDPKIFIRAAHAYGLIQWRKHPEFPEEIVDLGATFRTVVDRYALSCARQFRWGLLHGTPSAGNFQFDGAFLDNLTPATAPSRRGRVILTYPKTLALGEKDEFLARCQTLYMLWKTLNANLTQHEKEAYNFESFSGTLERFESFPGLKEVHEIFIKAFRKHLGIEILRAAGLKRDLAERIQDRYPDLVNDFRETIYALAIEENPGPIPMALDFNLTVQPDAPLVEKAVTDPFQLLGRYARIYFDPSAETKVDFVIDLLDPIYKGDVAVQKERVGELARAFLSLYDRVMQKAQELGQDLYDSLSEMRVAIIQKAEFENRPVGLENWKIRQELLNIVTGEDAKHDGRVFRDRDFVTRYIREKVERSLRNREQLLSRGEITEAPGNAFDVGVLVWNHIMTGIRADGQTGDRTFFVRIFLDDNDALPFAGVGSDVRTEDAILNFRFSDDEGEICNMNGRIVDRMLVFEIPVQKSQSGLFRGSLVVGNSVIPLFPRAFAVPDNVDLRRLVLREFDREIGFSEKDMDHLLASAITGNDDNVSGDKSQ